MDMNEMRLLDALFEFYYKVGDTIFKVDIYLVSLLNRKFFEVNIKVIKVDAS